MPSLPNSTEKETVRERWVALSCGILQRQGRPLDTFVLLTLPGEEMRDIHKYTESGLLTFAKTDTGLQYRGKGKLVWAEKSTTRFMSISRQLSRTVSYPGDISHFIMKEPRHFPFDSINLDINGPLFGIPERIDALFQRIFGLQSQHSRDFSLYLTFPETERDDPSDYRELLVSTIENNLRDVNNGAFATEFTKRIGSTVASLPYERRAVIAIAKIILRASASNSFQLRSYECYAYGNRAAGRQRMFSLLFDFEFKGPSTHWGTLYYTDVLKILHDPVELRSAV